MKKSVMNKMNSAFTFMDRNFTAIAITVNGPCLVAAYCGSKYGFIGIVAFIVLLLIWTFPKVQNFAEYLKEQAQESHCPYSQEEARGASKSTKEVARILNIVSRFIENNFLAVCASICGSCLSGHYFGYHFGGASAIAVSAVVLIYVWPSLKAYSDYNRKLECGYSSLYPCCEAHLAITSEEPAANSIVRLTSAFRFVEKRLMTIIAISFVGSFLGMFLGAQFKFDFAIKLGLEWLITTLVLLGIYLSPLVANYVKYLLRYDLESASF